LFLAASLAISAPVIDQSMGVAVSVPKAVDTASQSQDMTLCQSNNCELRSGSVAWHSDLNNMNSTVSGVAFSVMPGVEHCCDSFEGASQHPFDEAQSWQVNYNFDTGGAVKAWNLDDFMGELSVKSRSLYLLHQVLLYDVESKSAINVRLPLNPLFHSNRSEAQLHNQCCVGTGVEGLLKKTNSLHLRNTLNDTSVKNNDLSCFANIAMVNDRSFGTAIGQRQIDNSMYSVSAVLQFCNDSGCTLKLPGSLWPLI